MICEATAHDLERFRTVISQKIGLWFEDSKLGFLGEVLRRRLEKLQRGNDYIRDLEHTPPQGEIAALARELTVGETYFFRHNDQFRALAEVALPERMRGRDNCRRFCVCCRPAAPPAKRPIRSPSWRGRPSPIRRGMSRSARSISIRRCWKRRRGGAIRPGRCAKTPADIQRKWFRADGRDLFLTMPCAAPFSSDAGKSGERRPGAMAGGASTT